MAMAFIRNYPDDTPRTGGAAFIVLLMILGTVAAIFVSGVAGTAQTTTARIHSTPADLTQPGASQFEQIDPGMTATISAGEPLADETSATADATAACNLSACAASYRSFRASDCTYQPFDGGRRLCTK
jgi:hypothetical protein